MPGRRSRGGPPHDDGGEHQHGEDADALHDQQGAGGGAAVAGVERGDAEGREERDGHPGPGGADAQRVQERLGEDTGRGEGADEKGEVGAQQGEAAEETGAGADGGPGQGVDGTGLVEVLGQPPEAVGDQADTEQAEQEDEGDGLADRGCHSGPVEAHGECRPHEADGEG